MTKHIDVLGRQFDAISQQEAVKLVLSWIASEEPKQRHIVTVNVSILVMARKAESLDHAIRKADLVVADGKPLIWASRLLGTSLPERVTGVDLMERLLESGQTQRIRVFLLGTTQERLDVLTTVIRQRYPEIVVCGARNGFFQEADYASVVAQVGAAKADLLLVGMPAPFKETWCEQYREELGARVILGVGGSFDVIAGFVPRAPRLLQEAGLEWAWRLAMEPRKLWKRYLVSNTTFMLLLVKEFFRKLHK